MTSTPALTRPRSVDDAFQDVLLVLFQLHGRVLEAADVMSAEFGLTGARWQVMKVVARRPMTVSQVARRLGLQRQSVQRTVDHLREQGIVEVRPNVDHLRAGLVALTVAGERALDALDERQQAWLARCMRGMSRSDLGRLARSLEELNQRVEKATSREHTARATAAVGARGPRGASVRRRLVAA